MKLIIAQLKTLKDKVEKNLNNAFNFLKNQKKEKPDLIIFPRSYLLGTPISESNLTNNEQKKASEDWLELSKKFPDFHLATTTIDSYNNQEVALIVKNGQVKSQQYSRNNQSALEIENNKFYLNKYNIVLLFGNIEKELLKKFQKNDFLIIFDHEIYQGQPVDPAKIKEKYPAPSCWKARVNACGGQDAKIFSGLSYVLDEKNNFCAYSSQPFEADYILIDTENKQIQKAPKKYNKIETLHLALLTGLKDFVTGAGFKKVLLGLSGGLDSAVCAVLASQALGSENVLGIALPSPYNLPESFNDAQTLAENLKIDFKNIPITALFQQSLETLKNHLNPKKDSALMEENLQARLRGLLLMALANQDQRLLISTSNKSEADIGYTTLYGDMCGAIAILADIYKTEVYQLAHYLNSKEKNIPLNTIQRPPSAELKSEQSDQDFLPPYEILDEILKRYLELGQSQEEIITAMDCEANIIIKIIIMHHNNSFKAIQAPAKLICRPKGIRN